MSAYLLIRGMKTLALRIERQTYNAQKVAEYLEKHPKIEKVFYPGLSSHPQHEIAKAQMHGGFGGMLSFSVKGGFESGVKPCMTNLKYAFRAAHLGGVETIVGPPRTASHVELTAEERKRAGIPENLIRYSTGIESYHDLIADLEQALEKVKI
jgi:cystathionine gamma-synthase